MKFYDLLMLRIYEYVQIRIDRCFDAEIIHIPTHPVDCINRSIVYEVTVIHAQPRTPDSHRIYAAGSSTARAETVNSAVLPVRQPSLVSSKMRVICADVAALTALCGRADLGNPLPTRITALLIAVANANNYVSSHRISVVV